MTYKQITQRMLSFLYNLKQQHGADYFNLQAILTKIDKLQFFDDVHHISRYLESQGYINLQQKYGVDYGQINTHGIQYVENTQSILTDFEQYCTENNIILEADKLDGNTTNSTQAAIIALVKKIKAPFNKNRSLLMKDPKRDLDIIEIELQKANPDKEILAIKIRGLEVFGAIEPDLQALKTALEITY